MAESTNIRRKVPVLIYVLSGLSLVPFIGAFIGLLVLMSGITVYRSRVLIIIGSFGLLFTISIYGTLYYFGQIQRGGIYDKMTENLSSMSLKMLTQQIELYKVRTGKYPTNIEQTTFGEYNQLHIDPILNKICDEDENKSFYYKLNNNGYELFSVGFDKTPYTQDDILPQLSEEEIAKYAIRNVKR